MYVGSVFTLWSTNFHTDWHGKEKSREGGNMSSLPPYAGRNYSRPWGVHSPRQNFKFASNFDSLYNISWSRASSKKERGITT
jgi:hypothetical protein